MKRLIAVIIFIQFTLSLAYSQTTVQNLYWLRYYAQFKLSERTSWHFELDDRFFFETSNAFQLIVHNHFHYKISPYFDVAAGLSYSRTNSTRTPTLVVPEWRPFQEVHVDFFPSMRQHKPVIFRLRVDERFIHANNGTELQSGLRYNTRFRFRFQTAWQIASFKEGKKQLVAKANDEYMVQYGDVVTTFDQNRIYGAIEYFFKPSMSLELGYLNIYQANGTDKHFLRHIMRFTFTHRLRLYRES